MGWNANGSSFTETELDRISKMYYDCADEKKKIELALSEAEFHYKHLKRNMSNSSIKLFTWTFAIIPLTLILIAYIVDVIAILKEGASGQWDGFVLLPDFLCIAFVGPFSIKLWKQYLSTANRFVGVDEKLLGHERYRKNYDDDEKETEDTLAMLKMSMERINAEIEELERLKNDELEKLRESKLKKKEEEIEVSDDDKEQKGFRVRPVIFDESERKELLKSYDYDIERLTGELNELERQYYDSYNLADKIDAEGEQAIRNLILMIAIYIMLSVFAGIVMSNVGSMGILISNIVMVSVFFFILYRFVKDYSPKIRLYTVEHNRDLIRTYADNRGLYPTEKIRSELSERIGACQRELTAANYNKMLVKEGIKNN
ncbi:MAG: hypothetical protein IKQ71_05940 [Lachnospiraceae bacterium]|nr:hypothetical protein [Lachnospiraceae bacterium]